LRCSSFATGATKNRILFPKTGGDDRTMITRNGQETNDHTGYDRLLEHKDITPACLGLE
jgi:hypothetical protein